MSMQFGNIAKLYYQTFTINTLSIVLGIVKCKKANTILFNIE
jgi:hypothetical protein